MSHATHSETHADNHDHSAGNSAGHVEHKINYLLIFFTLVVLTVVTVLIAFKRFDNEVVNVALALLVATIKATFVARYFMHLKFEGKLILAIFVVPLALTVLIIAALIPDVGRGLKNVAHRPEILHHDMPDDKMGHY